MTTRHPDLGDPSAMPPDLFRRTQELDRERMVPRELDSVPPVHPALAERITTAEVAARELDVRESRALAILRVALDELEARTEPVEVSSGGFREHAHKVRGAIRNANEALVELGSIAGEHDGLARGL